MRTPLITLILTAFILNSIGPMPVLAQSLILPKPGEMVRLSPAYNPSTLRGIKIDPQNPMRFDFILDQGQGIYEKDEATKLIKYFLAAVTVPEADLWVNLSPYEKDRIIPDAFGKSEMGRDLLAQDYMLKQITASLIYPEDEIGKEFWKRIYAKAAKEYGTTNVPINTFNKVWIMPDKAVVYEKEGIAYIEQSSLKVMLEQDYLALEKNSKDSLPLEGRVREGVNKPNALGSQIVRELILPELTREVNQGKNFAQLRQIYNSLILATWYKRKLKESLLAQVYADKNKVNGLSSPNALIGDPNKNDTEAIYHQYLQAFKKGAFNYLKEEIDPLTQEVVPRKYFSGGCKLGLPNIVVGIGEGVVNDRKTVLVAANIGLIGYLQGFIDVLGKLNITQANTNAQLGEQMNGFVAKLLQEGLAQQNIIPNVEGIGGVRKITLKATDPEMIRLRDTLFNPNGGIGAINFRGENGMWCVIGFEGDMDKHWEHEIEEIKGRKNGRHWTTVHNELIRKTVSTAVAGQEITAPEYSWEDLEREGYKLDFKQTESEGGERIEITVNLTGNFNEKSPDIKLQVFFGEQKLVYIENFYPEFPKDTVGRGRALLREILKRMSLEDHHLLINASENFKKSLGNLYEYQVGDVQVFNPIDHSARESYLKKLGEVNRDLLGSYFENSNQILIPDRKVSTGVAMKKANLIFARQQNILGTAEARDQLQGSVDPVDTLDEYLKSQGNSQEEIVKLRVVLTRDKKKYIEIGFGDGKVALAKAKDPRFKDYDFIIVDMEPVGIEGLRAAQLNNLVVLKGNMDLLQYIGANSVDVVQLINPKMEMVEELLDTRLNHLNRMLKEDGQVVIKPRDVLPVGKYAFFPSNTFVRDNPMLSFDYEFINKASGSVRDFSDATHNVGSNMTIQYVFTKKQDAKNLNGRIIGASHGQDGRYKHMMDLMTRINRMKYSGDWNKLFTDLENAEANQADKTFLDAAIAQLTSAGVGDKWQEEIAKRIILVDVNKEERRLGDKDTGEDYLGGLIIRHNGVLKILLPRSRFTQKVEPKHLADLLHEIVEIQMLENDIVPEQAHKIAIEREKVFIEAQRNPSMQRLTLNPYAFGYKWRTEKEGVRSVQAAIEHYRNDIWMEYQDFLHADDEKPFSSERLQALKDLVYKIRYYDLEEWGIHLIINDAGKKAPYFKGSYPKALSMSLPGLDLKEDKFSAPITDRQSWEQFENPHLVAKTILIERIKKRNPALIERFEQYKQDKAAGIAWDWERLVDLKDEFYGIYGSTIGSWGLQWAIKLFFNNSYAKLIVESFAELELTEDNFSYDIQTKGPEAVLELVLRRIRPDIWQEYAQYVADKHSFAEERLAKLKEEVYRIKTVDFISVGIDRALEKKDAEGLPVYVLFLTKFFQELRLNKYAFRYDSNNRTRSVQASFERHMPALWREYQDLIQGRIVPDSPRFQGVQNKFYALKAIDLRAWGLDYAIKQAGGYEEIIVDSFKELKLDRNAFKVQSEAKYKDWKDNDSPDPNDPRYPKDEGYLNPGFRWAHLNVRHAIRGSMSGLWKDYQEYKKDPSSFDFYKLRRLREKFYMLTTADFMRMGLTVVIDYKKTIFQGVHSRALIESFPELQLSPYGFEGKWSTPYKSIKKIQFAIEQYWPHLWQDYEKYRRLVQSGQSINAKDLMRLREQLYQIDSMSLRRRVGSFMESKFLGTEYAIAIIESLINTLDYDIEDLQSLPKKPKDAPPEPDGIIGASHDDAAKGQDVDQVMVEIKRSVSPDTRSLLDEIDRIEFAQIRSPGHRAFNPLESILSEDYIYEKKMSDPDFKSVLNYLRLFWQKHGLIESLENPYYWIADRLSSVYESEKLISFSSMLEKAARSDLPDAWKLSLYFAGANLGPHLRRDREEHLNEALENGEAGLLDCDLIINHLLVLVDKYIEISKQEGKSHQELLLGIASLLDPRVYPESSPLVKLRSGFKLRQKLFEELKKRDAFFIKKMYQEIIGVSQVEGNGDWYSLGLKEPWVIVPGDDIVKSGKADELKVFRAGESRSTDLKNKNNYLNELNKDLSVLGLNEDSVRELEKGGADLTQGLVSASHDAAKEQKIDKLSAEKRNQLLAEMKHFLIVDEQSGKIRFNAEVEPLKLKFNLVYARHGETGANSVGKIQGKADGPENRLNDEGQRQAVALAEKLNGDAKLKGIDKPLVVITSQLERTRQTAEPFLSAFKGAVEIVKDEEIKAGANEIGMGGLENKTELEARNVSGGAVFRGAYKDGHNTLVKAPGGGESYLELVERTYRWVEELNRLYAGRTVVVFGHSVQQSALNIVLKDQSMDDSNGYIDWRKNRLGNSEYRVYSGGLSADLGVEIPGEDALGGIDLTQGDKALEVKAGFPTTVAANQQSGLGMGQGINFNIDPAMIEEFKNAQGFVPVIINVQPITDLRKFLGLNIN